SDFSIGSFTDLQSRFVQVGSNGAIRLDGGDMIVLLGVQMSTLTSGDFVLSGSSSPRIYEERPSLLSEPELDLVRFGMEVRWREGRHGVEIAELSSDDVLSTTLPVVSRMSWEQAPAPEAIPAPQALVSPDAPVGLISTPLPWGEKAEEDLSAVLSSGALASVLQTDAPIALPRETGMVWTETRLGFALAGILADEEAPVPAYASTDPNAALDQVPHAFLAEPVPDDLTGLHDAMARFTFTDTRWADTSVL
ncbi:MAG: hypothetical protein KGS00_14520, partial [Alphaproteobacteria bacterium]|nr:hypothetical protein [Alphaproteobacteria bacterium]